MLTTGATFSGVQLTLYGGSLPAHIANGLHLDLDVAVPCVFESVDLLRLTEVYRTKDNDLLPLGLPCDLVGNPAWPEMRLTFSNLSAGTCVCFAMPFTNLI